MANIDAPFGFRPIKHLFGLNWSGSVFRYSVASDYATALFIGDPVIPAGSADTTGKYPTVQRATAGDGNMITGVIVGCGYDPTDLTLKYIPASTGGYVDVCIDPFVIYEIQDDGGAALAATSVSLNANIIFTHSGNTTTGLSGCELDAGTSDGPDADDSNQLLIMRLADNPKNALGVHAVWEVLINKHQLKATGDGHASVGV